MTVTEILCFLIASIVVAALIRALFIVIDQSIDVPAPPARPAGADRSGDESRQADERQGDPHRPGRSAATATRRCLKCNAEYRVFADWVHGLGRLCRKCGKSAQYRTWTSRCGDKLCSGFLIAVEWDGSFPYFIILSDSGQTISRILWRDFSVADQEFVNSQIRHGEISAPTEAVLFLGLAKVTRTSQNTRQTSGATEAPPPPKRTPVAWAYLELHLPDGAPFEEVKAQYNVLSKRYHPDLNGGDPAYKKIQQQLNMAFEQIRKYCNQ
jgi:hypothetical protein